MHCELVGVGVLWSVCGFIWVLLFCDMRIGVMVGGEVCFGSPHCPGIASRWLGRLVSLGNFCDDS